MKKVIILVLLLCILAGCTPRQFPASWRGRLVEWYEVEGHQVFHVEMDEGASPTPKEVADIVTWTIEITRDYLAPGHGLYIVVERGESCLLVIGLTWGAAREWGGDDFDLLDIAWPVALTSLHSGLWPDWVDDKVVVCGYAWYLGLLNYEKHYWFAELSCGRPLPLDSAFAREGG